MDKYQTLREKDNPSNNVFPNIATQNIPDSGVTTAKIIDGGVTTAKIEDGGVTTAKIANDAVVSGKIADGAVTTTKLGSRAVTGAKIALSTIVSENINSRTIVSDNIADNGINTRTIANGAVVRRHLSLARMPLDELLHDTYNVTDLASLAVAIRSILRMDSSFVVAINFVPSLTNEIAPVTFMVDASNMVSWWKADDTASLNDIVDDAGVTAFLAGDAKNIEVLLLN